jgi:hypothetical protein
MFKFGSSKSSPTILNLADNEEKKEEKKEEKQVKVKSAEIDIAPVRDPIPHYLAPPRPSQIRRTAVVPVPAPAPLEPVAKARPEVDDMVLEPLAHPHAPLRPNTAVHLVAQDIPDAVIAAALRRPERSSQPRTMFHETASMPVAKPAQKPEPPVYIPEVRDPVERAVANSVAEPQHRPSASRLAAIREDISASYPRLSPSQRAARNRADAARNGRAPYVTYTVDRHDQAVQSAQPDRPAQEKYRK